MSRTKRIYNFPNRIFSMWDRDVGWVPFWHPYKEIWKSKNLFEREWKVHKWKRQQLKREMNVEIKNL